MFSRFMVAAVTMFPLLGLPASADAKPPVIRGVPGGWGWGGPAWGYDYPYYYGGYYYEPYTPRYVVPDTTYRSYYYAPETVDRDGALIRVRVPATAEIWINGEKMRQTGAEREFVTPALAPRSTHLYEVRARWMDGDRAVDQTRRLSLRTGDRLSVDFLQPETRRPEPTREPLPPAEPSRQTEPKPIP